MEAEHLVGKEQEPGLGHQWGWTGPPAPSTGARCPSRQDRVGTRVFGLGGTNPWVCTVSAAGTGTGRARLPVAVGLGCTVPGRVQAHHPSWRNPTWSCGDSCAARARWEVSAAPPPPGRPRSAPRGAPGGSAPSPLPWLPGPPTCQPAAGRRGTAQPRPHGQGHPAPYPPRSPAHPTEPSHPGQACRIGPENQHCPLLPCASPVRPTGVHGWGLPAELPGGDPPPPAYAGPISVPATLLLHVPQCSQGSGPAQLLSKAPATPQPRLQTLSLYT